MFKSFKTNLLSFFVCFFCSSVGFAENLKIDNISDITINNKTDKVFPEGKVYTGIYNNSLEPHEEEKMSSPSKFQIHSKEYGWYKYSLDQVLSCLKNPHEPQCDIRVEFFFNKLEHTDYLIFSNKSTQEHIVYNIYGMNIIHTKETIFKINGDLRPLSLDYYCSIQGSYVVCTKPKSLDDTFFYLSAEYINKEFGVWRKPDNNSRDHTVPGTYGISYDGQTILENRYNCLADQHDEDSTKKVEAEGYEFTVSHLCSPANELLVFINTKKVAEITY